MYFLEYNYRQPLNIDTFLMLYQTELVSHGGLDGMGAGVRDKEWDNGWALFVRVDTI